MLASSSRPHSSLIAIVDLGWSWSNNVFQPGLPVPVLSPLTSIPLPNIKKATVVRSVKMGLEQSLNLGTAARYKKLTWHVEGVTLNDSREVQGVCHLALEIHVAPGSCWLCCT